MKDNLSFGEVLEHLKKGLIAERKGWNGKGMFIFMAQENKINLRQLKATVSMAAFSEILKRWTDYQEPDFITTLPHLCMRTVDGSIVIGWLASQTDMLSNDWQLI
jgi:Protein of unknown function (DUF2829)